MFLQAEIKYFDIANQDVSEIQSVLSPLFWQFGSSGGREQHAALLQEARHSILHRAAHLHYRLSVPFTQWPFRLCLLVDERIDFNKKERIAQEFFDTPLCCLDPHFSRKIHFPILESHPPPLSTLTSVCLASPRLCFGFEFWWVVSAGPPKQHFLV